ncbi:MAG: alpha-L-fucosidase, partial [Bacteroidales bacterium]|nr:alpha-L-fucosidase [Bacteroidales bacterium]
MSVRSLKIILFAVLSASVFSCSSPVQPEPLYPIPSENQMRWQEMEYYAFIHYSLNTYTDQSWGYGDEALELFNPKNLDCRQWARICKEAGMKGIIFTAKHHCGFCMWPSKYTEYSVKNTPWKDGKGDVVRELANACDEFGLEFGVYLSPWDRNHPAYGTQEYIEYFRNQLRELLSEYGPVFETWFDGAHGGSGYYGGPYEDRHIDRKTYYQWKETFAMARELQPGILIWNDGGDRGDLRWVGTEAGFVGETNWSQLNKEGEVEWNMLHYGLEGGDSWVCAEVNTSIRPEWFYHENENTKVKTVAQLMETYYHSVGRNATLLLNVPVMPDGLIHPLDEDRLMGFAEARKEAFKNDLAYRAKASSDSFRQGRRKFSASKAIDGKSDTYWTVDDGQTSGSIILDFGKEVCFNRFLVQEYIRLGQRVRGFSVEYMKDGEWHTIKEATTIGYKRILYFPTVMARYLRFTVTDSRACPLISNIEVYRAPQILEAPSVRRAKNGNVMIIPADAESEIYYTLDGSVPTVNSLKYVGPFYL